MRMLICAGLCTAHLLMAATLRAQVSLSSWGYRIGCCFANLGELLGGLLGAGVGALVGRSSYSERWERAHLETSLGLLRSHPEGWLPVPTLRIRLILS